jgi:hypothetical protein
MGEDLQQFWLVRAPHPGAIEVPVLHEEVARRFEADGWEVEQLPLALLDQRELNCLRKARRLRR